MFENKVLTPKSQQLIPLLNKFHSGTNLGPIPIEHKFYHYRTKVCPEIEKINQQGYRTKACQEIGKNIVELMFKHIQNSFQTYFMPLYKAYLEIPIYAIVP